MTTKTIWRLAVVGVVGGTALLARGDTDKAEGTLSLRTRTHKLAQAVAYKTTIDGDEATVVVAGAHAITSEKLKEARAADKEGTVPDFSRPYLRLVFSKTGELKDWGAADNNTSVSRRTRDPATGELTMREGRAVGKATRANNPDDMLPSSFDFKFDLALQKLVEPLSEPAAKKGGPAASVKPTVSGLFRGNGKEAKLAYVSAQWREPFNDKTGMMLVFTEKDHAKEKKPKVEAMFGKYGSALIISTHEDGGIYGCQVFHTAHQKQGFSSIGNINLSDFTYADGKVEGELSTNGQVDAFGETWEVKVKFVAPLGEIPKEFQVAETKTPKTDKEPETAASDFAGDKVSALMKSVGMPAGKSAGIGIKAKELSLPKDASEVEYQGRAGYLAFKSKSDVKKVCAELAASLKAQGWQNDGRDVVSPLSAILRRKQGQAKLTIIAKPEAGGSEVKMLTEGLSWD